MTEDELSVVKRFKDFGKKSSLKFKSIVDRMKQERAFASGHQWTAADDTNRGTDRARLTFNLVDNQINSAVNPFLSHPYKIQYQWLEDNPSDLVQKLNLYIQKLYDDNDFKVSSELAIRSNVTAGYGYYYVTTDADPTGKPIVKIYPIEDSTLVIPDPDSVQLDGSDASKMAIVEHMSKEKAKKLFGDDVVDSGYYESEIAVSDFGETWKSPPEYVTLVTFYEMTDSRNACVITKMIGNKVVNAVTLNIHHIPIVTFKGAISYDESGDISYNGLVHKIMDAQRVVNYAESQLVERLSNAPVPVMSIPTEGLDNNLDYYKNINRRLNPVVPYKQFTKDGKELREPKRIDNSFPTNDIGEVIGQSKAALSEVSGMPLTGMVEARDAETATSILLRSKSVANNITHYMDHAKTSTKFLGTLLLEFYKLLNPDANLDTSMVVVSVTEGPEYVFQSDEARAKLIAIANFLPPEQKNIIAYQLCKLDMNPDIKAAGEMIKQTLPPQVLSDNGQVMMLQQQMQQMQEQFKELMQSKDKQINDLNQQVLSLQLRSQSDVAIQQMKSQTELAKAEMDINADSQKQQLDIAAKANIENAKLAAQAQRDREKIIAEAMKYNSITQGY